MLKCLKFRAFNNIVYYSYGRDIVYREREIERECVAQVGPFGGGSDIQIHAIACVNYLVVILYS